MIKKTFIALGSLLLVVGMWFLFDYFHYSPPEMSDKEIKKEALQQLKPQATEIVRQYSNWKDSGMSSEVRSINVLKIGRIKGRTYLVYRLDYHENPSPQMIAQMGGQMINTDYYLLGLRLVEDSLTGIKLKQGMEFSGTYIDALPVDCGRHPDGIFYAYCKDPKVYSMKLESNDGRFYKAVAKDRIFLMAVPPGTDELHPRFFDRNGREMIPSSSLRIAFVCAEPKTYQPYANISAEWWPIPASDLVRQNADNLDAVWVFSDQLSAMRTPEMEEKLQELLKSGVQVLFIGWKDPQDIARLLPGSHLEKTSRAGAIEAVYATADTRGAIRVGTIGLDEQGTSPFLQKTMRLKFKIADDASYQAGKSPTQSGTSQVSGSARSVYQAAPPMARPKPITVKVVKP